MRLKILTGGSREGADFDVEVVGMWDVGVAGRNLSAAPHVQGQAMPWRRAICQAATWGWVGVVGAACVARATHNSAKWALAQRRGDWKAVLENIYVAI